ncbi:hypothetical protein BH10BAC5_BH10BAC5_07600 [soil metagenome]
MKNLLKNNSTTKESKVKNNKAYGYKELKSIYTKFLSEGLMLSVAFHLIVIGALVYSISRKPLIPEEKLQVRTVVINDINIPELIKEDVVIPEEREQPKGIKNVPLKNDQALVPVPVQKDKSEVSTTSTQKDLNEINTPVSKDGDPNASKDGQVGDPNGINNNTSKPVEKPVVKENPNKNFDAFQVERQPMQLNLNAVKASMVYPLIARESNIEGKVTVKVLVDKNGDVTKIGSVSGPSVFRDEVTSKVMALRFNPAMQNGEPVNCWVTVPFSFTLN